LAAHVQPHPVADPLELQPLLARPPAGAPRAADYRPVALPPAAGLVPQSPGPSRVDLEGVVDQQARVAAEGVTGPGPLLPPAHLVGGRPRGELAGGQEVGRPGGDGVGGLPFQAEPFALLELLPWLALGVGAGVVQIDLAGEHVNLGLRPAYGQAELGAAID